MAYLRTGHNDRVEDGQAETAAWARGTGLPLVEGFTVFWRSTWG